MPKAKIKKPTKAKEAEVTDEESPLHPIVSEVRKRIKKGEVPDDALRAVLKEKGMTLADYLEARKKARQEAEK